MPPQRTTIVGSIEDVLPVPDSAPALDSPRNNIFIRQCGSETLLIGLKYPSVLYFQGILEVNVLSGKLSTHGYCATDTDSHLPLRLFSLMEGSSEFICTTEDSHVSDPELDRYNHNREFRDSMADLFRCIRPVGSIVCVTSKVHEYAHWKICLDRHHLDLFPCLQKTAGFPVFAEAEKVLNCVLDVEDGSRIQRKFKINDDLESCANELLSCFKSSLSTSQDGQNFRTIVCGGKGVGKSSYLKYIGNRFLSVTPYLYIDLDVGQSEFTLCGTVSAVIIDVPLIGPNYSHLKRPLRSYLVGDANPAQCFNAYLCAVSEIFRFCFESEQCKALPWFVNTMGMTKGLGLDVITSVVNILKPHHIIQIQGGNRANNFSFNITPEFLKQFIPNVATQSVHDINFIHHSVTSASNVSTIRAGPLPSSQRLREAMAIVYLSEILSKDCMSEKAKWLHICSDDKELLHENLIFGDIIALCKKESELISACYGFGMTYEVSNQHALAILSPVESCYFHQIDELVKSPIVFKAGVILNHFKHSFGVIPYFSTFNVEYLKPDKKDIMRALFAL